MKGKRIKLISLLLIATFAWQAECRAGWLRPLAAGERLAKSASKIEDLLTKIYQRYQANQVILDSIGEIRSLLAGLDDPHRRFVDVWPGTILFERNGSKILGAPGFIVQGSLINFKKEIGYAMEKYPINQRLPDYDIYVDGENMGRAEVETAVRQLTDMINLLNRVSPNNRLTSTHFIALTSLENIFGAAHPYFPGETLLHWPVSGLVDPITILSHENDHHAFSGEYGDWVFVKDPYNQDVPRRLWLKTVTGFRTPYDYFLEARGYLADVNDLANLAYYYLAQSDFREADDAASSALRDLKHAAKILKSIKEMGKVELLSDLGNRVYGQLAQSYSAVLKRVLPLKKLIKSRSSSVPKIGPVPFGQLRPVVDESVLRPLATGE